MAVAANWNALALTIDQQCAVIAERCVAMRCKNPLWTPRRFSYFSGAKANRAAAKSISLPTGTAKALQIDGTIKVERYKKIARLER